VSLVAALTDEVPVILEDEVVHFLKVAFALGAQGFIIKKHISQK
jgi:hypothetical protein